MQMKKKKRILGAVLRLLNDLNFSSFGVFQNFFCGLNPEYLFAPCVPILVCNP